MLPTTVLSEPRGLPLFQVVRGGIEFKMGLGPKPCANPLSDPYPQQYRGEVASGAL